MRRSLTLSILSLSFFMVALSAKAQNQSYDTKHYNLKKGLAIQGYDPVAYFTENKAVEGDEKISVKINGVTYYFSSEANKQLFVKSPSKYEPEYGGYCAYAMATGDKVRIDPETFKIVDNKLYLFYNFRFTNTLKSWNKDESNLLPKAEREWGKIIGGK
ncbi:YHS domain-containing (seleno)protein [Roseivirga misakiensis]|uniref:YHS domain protein n=1 Tax=Roseivirga misakiensis TaxID=1563681 RepID=A0A1E5T3R0_9BACT|nr:YHS domain-containing (seleno)protein [Roseivirga misakiensis]OEK05971.1 YHS domain protein [Roseivirga misakiensis]